MFFFLSKILTFLISPLVWFFSLMIWSYKTKNEYKRKKIFISGLLMLYLFSNSFVMDEIARAWEPVTSDYYMTDEKFDLAIVLGGIGRIDERQKRFDFGYSADRLFQTLELYYRGRVNQILFSGGSGSIRFPDQKEALYIKKYLNTIKVPDSSLIIEPESKNTYENAVNTKIILDSLKFTGSILLVTSAYHMPRSLATFQKAGFTKLTPYITNRLSGPRRFDWDHCFLPSSDALITWNMLVHEWVGFLVYKVKGYA